MQERALTRAVALVEIAMTGPAAERLSGIGTTPFEIVLHSVIMPAVFVAVEQLRQITRSEESETPYTHPPALMIHHCHHPSSSDHFNSGYHFHPARSTH